LSNCRVRSTSWINEVCNCLRLWEATSKMIKGKIIEFRTRHLTLLKFGKFDHDDLSNLCFFLVLIFRKNVWFKEFVYDQINRLRAEMIISNFKYYYCYFGFPCNAECTPFYKLSAGLRTIMISKLVLEYYLPEVFFFKNIIYP